MAEILLFGLFAVVAVISSLTVILHRNPVHSTLSLVVTLLATAGLFVMLGAPFLGALQVLVYAGAIVVLFLFVIMLLNLQREKADRSRRGGGRALVVTVVAFVFAGIVTRLFWDAHSASAVPTLTEEYVALKPFARELFGNQMLPFQLVGVLLLVAVVVVSWVAERARKATTSEEEDAQ